MAFNRQASMNLFVPVPCPAADKSIHQIFWADRMEAPATLGRAGCWWLQMTQTALRGISESGTPLKVSAVLYDGDYSQRCGGAGFVTPLRPEPPA